MENKEETIVEVKPKKKFNFNKFFDIFCWVMSGLVMLFVIYGLTLKFTGNDIYLFGLRVDVVTSESMAYVNEDPEVQAFLEGHTDQFQKGDLLFSKKITVDTELKVYDLVMFNNIETGRLTTHRIVRIYQDTNGETKYVIRADTANHESYDGAYTRKFLVAKVEGIAAGIGHVFQFFTSIFGFILLAGLIFILFITDYLLNKAKEKELALEQANNIKTIDTTTTEEKSDSVTSEEQKEDTSEDNSEQTEETEQNEESEKTEETEQIEESAEESNNEDSNKEED